MDTRITKDIAINIQLIGLVLFLSGCVNLVNTPESPTLTKATSSPSATATVPATEMQFPLIQPLLKTL